MENTIIPETQPIVVNPEQEQTVTPPQAPTDSVEAQAARFLSERIPMFRLKLRKLEERNKHEVSRVLEALIEAPLEQETHRFTTERGNDLYQLGLMIFNAKLMLFNAALKVDSIVQEATDKAVEDTNKQTAQESNPENVG